MVAKGQAVVLVSHKMAETMEYTDWLTVLRRGVNAGSVQTAESSPADVARMMFGDSDAAERTSFETSTSVGEPVLTLNGVSAAGDNGLRAVDDASLVVRRGQVVGVAGVAGNGQRELQEAIAGLRSVDAARSISQESTAHRAGRRKP